MNCKGEEDRETNKNILLLVLNTSVSSPKGKLSSTFFNDNTKSLNSSMFMFNKVEGCQSSPLTLTLQCTGCINGYSHSTILEDQETHRGKILRYLAYSPFTILIHLPLHQRKHVSISACEPAPLSKEIFLLLHYFVPVQNLFLH